MSSKVKGFIALTGGGVGSLDAIDGAGLADKDYAFGVVDGVQHCYWLDYDSGAAENSPYIIAPDVNAGNKRWILSNFQSAFSHVEANRATAQSIPNATDTIVIFDTEIKDTLSEYNNSIGRFSATYAGHYLISGAIILDSTAFLVGEVCLLDIHVNGTKERHGFRNSAHANATVYQGSLVSSTIYLTAGQYVELNANQGTGAAVNLFNDATFNYLTIDRIA